LLKDRRKDWQKSCINYSWSRCGTIATERAPKYRAKRAKAFLTGGGYQTKFAWYDAPPTNKYRAHLDAAE
jgi:hypothetical protein